MTVAPVVFGGSQWASLTFCSLKKTKLPLIWDKSAMPEICRSSACLPPGYNKRPTSVGSLRAKRVDDSFFKTGSAEMIESTLMCFLKNSANRRNGLYALGHKVVVA